MADLSEVVPTLAKVYPNGQADVNHFHACGGVPFMVRTLLDAGLLHEDVHTVVGKGLRRYIPEPLLDGDQPGVRDGPGQSLGGKLLAPAESDTKSGGEGKGVSV